MPTQTPNLTQSSARIYIQDPQRLLEDIFWKSVNGLSKTGDPIRTTNGVNIYLIPTRPAIQQIVLTKDANPDEDKIIVNWADTFCQQEPIIEGSTQGGAILMIIPLKPCVAEEFYNVSGKAYNIVPTGWNGWGFDITNNTDMSTFTLNLTATEVTIN